MSPGFQSTRLSRASTSVAAHWLRPPEYFNPQGSREPRPDWFNKLDQTQKISIHKALASLDPHFSCFFYIPIISIHKALASLDKSPAYNAVVGQDFNPQGSREPRRPCHQSGIQTCWQFQSTRLSRASTGRAVSPMLSIASISIHKALASLDAKLTNYRIEQLISIHKALASLDTIRAGYSMLENISIHKALASLDSKTIQQSLHIPLTFYALCPPLLISTSSIHSPSLFSRLFRCFSGANLPGISC